MRFDEKSALPLIRLALKEDIGSGDVTSRLLPAPRKSAAFLIAREPGVVCGLPILPLILKELGGTVRVRLLVREGDPVRAGQRLVKLTGPVRTLLTAERTMLNFLSALSGMATLTRRYVNAVNGTRAGIYDTRKTPPGMRALAKYAVRVGKGKNHRFGLYDMILVKDNHVAELGIAEALRRSRRRYPGLTVEVETENLAQFSEALAASPDIIMLDNIQLEASGGIILKNVRAVAKTGVDRISVGAITHSSPILDISMEMV